MQQRNREYDTLCTERAAKRVLVERASAEDLVTSHPDLGVYLTPPYAPLEVCEVMRQRHRDNLWAIRSTADRSLIGFYYMLMLSPAGLEALQTDRFDPIAPQLDHVAATGDPVSAVFKWCVIAPGVARHAIPLIAQFLRTPPYRKVDLYGHAGTARGRALMLGLNFEPLPLKSKVPLYRYQRLANRPRYQPN